MRFIADFHIHSKFSRATAKNLDLENLYIAAQLKGLTVIGTGDFTHPQWFSEITTKLEPAEPGLYQLKKDIAQTCDQRVPLACRAPVRFMLVSEISNIYKKNGKTRKNHNLIFLPDLEYARIFAEKLDHIGNIHSDGRPILGLDAKHLLEIQLESSLDGFFIPAHIWTPWFSLFGSKSGFDSIEECFEDLTPYIFAVETGLSSDPSMNWRVSQLDGLTLVSNSDAHSPMKIGREANLFDTELTYANIRSALQSGDSERFRGTIEFYPEEGKYHLDGHRKCRICMWPSKTIQAEGVCPICAKPLTLGVLYQVEILADRLENQKPAKTHPFCNLVPLTDILSEIMQVGPNSKKVQSTYHHLISALGPELPILLSLPIETINTAGVALLGAAIKKMRANEIHLIPGYDGEYGRIKIFSDEERKQLSGQKTLFISNQQSAIEPRVDPTLQSKMLSANKPIASNRKSSGSKTIQSHNDSGPLSEREGIDFLHSLNMQQLEAVKHGTGPLMIVAGPGTGKTRTLTYRMAYLILEKKIPSNAMLALTFTNKAAQEMKNRLSRLLTETDCLPGVYTFHRLCLALLKDWQDSDLIPATDRFHDLLANDEDRLAVVRLATWKLKQSGQPVSIKPQVALKWITTAKQQMLNPTAAFNFIDTASDAKMFASIYNTYQKFLAVQKLWDFEDLVFNVVTRFETEPDLLETYRQKYRHMFVDEYQDLNHGQYRLIRALATKHKDICVIGDPDQAIYGFRGAEAAYFNRFIKDYPDARLIQLTRNYRSTETILDASYQIIQNNSQSVSKPRVYSQIKGQKTISIHPLPNERSEAVFIGQTIEKMIGGIGFYSIDFDKIDDKHQSMQTHSFKDIAVLYRTKRQGDLIAEIFLKAGIPFQIANRETLLHSNEASRLISLLKVIHNEGGFKDYERSLEFFNDSISTKTWRLFFGWTLESGNSLATACKQIDVRSLNQLAVIQQNYLREAIVKMNELQKAMRDLTTIQALQFLKTYPPISKQCQANERFAEALQYLINYADTYPINDSEFFLNLDLQSDTDLYNTESESVGLMTMHAAKGLEFPVVFIAGCEDDYIPFRKTNEQIVDLDEERRLFYVAMTRAQDILVLTWAQHRNLFGHQTTRKLSPFVTDIENRLLAFQKLAKNRRFKKRPQQMNLF